MKFFSTSLLIALSIGILNGQRFVDPISLFSKKKTAYITLADGTEIEGTLKKVLRKKGQVESIKLNLENGDVKEYEPADIQFAFLPQSGFEKFGDANARAFDATRWGEESVEGERIKNGYGYFESQKAQIKKKNIHLLMQVANPHFNKHITMYFDPLAGETTSMSVGGIKVAGGIEKSYYVRLDDGGDAFRMKKKEYDDMLKKLFGDCDKYLTEGEKSANWSELPKHIFNYTQNCGE